MCYQIKICVLYLSLNIVEIHNYCLSFLCICSQKSQHCDSSKLFYVVHVFNWVKTDFINQNTCYFQIHLIVCMTRFRYDKIEEAKQKTVKIKKMLTLHNITDHIQ